MTVVNIRYPEFDEPLRATDLGGSLVRLEQASEHVPLTSGDVVRQEDGVVVEAVELTDHFIVVVDFPLCCEQSLVDGCLSRWTQATWAVQTTACTALVRSLSIQWLVDEVVNDPGVTAVTLLRVPTQWVDLRAAVAEASGTAVR